MSERQAGRIVPVILSGGSGTRLWPLSRSQRPKQLLKLLGDLSLLQETARRLADPSRFARPVLVCGEDHRFVIAEQLQEIGIEPAAIALEPVARNTAPAIAAAALLCGPDDLLLAVPSDAWVADAEGYRDSIARAAVAAADGWLVAFGVAPSRAETGYGYIRRGDAWAAPGIGRIAEFREKPDAEAAARYLAEGEWLWNAGMFLFRAGRYLEELGRHAPEVLDAARKAVAGAKKDADFTWLSAPEFAGSPAISIDHAVMEKTSHAAVVPLATRWSDVGSWEELWRTQEPDEAGNVFVGNVIDEDSAGSYVRGDGRLIATLGLRDQIVVATKDVVLVAPRDRCQEVRKFADRVAAAGRTEHESHPRVHRPWGYYESVDSGPGFQVKRIMVKPGGRLSLQRHARRSEHWVVVAGTARVTVGEEIADLCANQSAHVPLGAVHRLENPTGERLYMIEVQCGDYLGEDDIERLEDAYNRA